LQNVRIADDRQLVVLTCNFVARLHQKIDVEVWLASTNRAPWNMVTGGEVLDIFDGRAVV
jgi:hypothetical protein